LDLTMKIKILGAHNTESRNSKFMTLLIDDVLVLDAGGLTSALSFRDQIKIKNVLITHAHYDHIRDLPALAMNFFMRNKTFDLYTHQSVVDMLLNHWLNGDTYPEFHKRPAENPTLRIHLIQSGQEFVLENYRVLPVTVTHAIPAVGYQVSSASGKTIFYTGDTGEGLSDVWSRVSPQILFIELTAANRWEESMKHSGHLTVSLLHKELIRFH